MVTGKEFVSQKWLPEKNLYLKYGYQKRIGISTNVTKTNIFLLQSLKTNSFLSFNKSKQIYTVIQSITNIVSLGEPSIQKDKKL